MQVCLQQDAKRSGSGSIRPRSRHLANWMKHTSHLWFWFIRFVNILHCRQRTEQGPRATCTENFVKFVWVFFEICEGQTDKQIYKRTDTLMAILCNTTKDEVIRLIFQKLLTIQSKPVKTLPHKQRNRVREQLILTAFTAWCTSVICSELKPFL